MAQYGGFMNFFLSLVFRVSFASEKPPMNQGEKISAFGLQISLIASHQGHKKEGEGAHKGGWGDS